MATRDRLNDIGDWLDEMYTKANEAKATAEAVITKLSDLDALLTLAYDEVDEDEAFEQLELFEDDGEDLHDDEDV